MEEVPGIPGALPPLTPYRPKGKLPPEEWQACLDAWLMSIEVRLRLQDNHFAKLSFSEKVSGAPFLVSYFGTHQVQSLHRSSAREVVLHKHCYLLTKRLLLQIPTPNMLKPYDMVNFILGANTTFHGISEWQRTLQQSVFVRSAQFDSGMAAWKTMLSNEAAGDGSNSILDTLKSMNMMIRLLPKAGFELMKGADYIESLMQVYLTGNKPLQAAITEHAYRSLLSLISPQRVSVSTLMDQIYLLKTGSEQAQKSNHEQKTLCTSLLCETGFLRHLQGDAGVNDTQRGRGLIDSLIAYREQNKHLHPLPAPRKRKVSKGKGRATTSDEMHIHKAAQISQVHDLFPDRPTAYILRLLDHFHDNTEQVIAALLEPDSLPPMLQDQHTDTEITKAISAPPDLAPRSTPPLLPQRKNVFDNDDFDNLRISSTKLHRGRKTLTISDPTTTDEHTNRKAAIMAALAAFDSDDDERDDTYDVADVGGSVDQSVDTDTRGGPSSSHDPHEETLFRAWKDTPSLFARDSKTRASNVRQSLKRETGMTDEQIEGWAIMVSKDQGKQERLQKRYSAVATFRGNLHGGGGAVGRTKWQQNTDGVGTSTENSHDEGDNDEGADGRRMGQAQVRGNRNWGGRGRGRGRGGTGTGAGGVAGPSANMIPVSQATKNRSEHSKEHGGYRGGRGGRANHNRREGRAKKMGRGFGGAGPES